MENYKPRSGRDYIVPIDGLRALAVSAVLLFHADFPWASGGFVGVDVFFVISGFLITRNIVGDADSGGWSASRFYLRRVARLFPALFVTIMLTLIGAWWVLSPDDLARVGRTSMMAVLSVGNVFFWLESGYFDSTSASKPLLHTWSLAVEEQFYLLWPVTLLVLSKLGRTGRIAGIVALSVVSVAAALFYLNKDAAAVFFLTPFRVYQFGLGAMIGLIGLAPRNVFSSVVCALGVGIVLLVGHFADGHTSPYWLAAILPAVAAAAIIATSRSTFADVVIGSGPAVWIGRRSYSIYLAHWPIMILWKMKTDFQFSMTESVIAVIISILAGTALYELVERRFRFHSTQSAVFQGRVVAGVVAVGVASITTGAHYWGERGYASRQSAEIVAITENLEDHWVERRHLVRDGICSLQVSTIIATDYDAGRCSAPPSGKQSYLVIGDSFANDTYLVLKTAYPDIYFGQLSVPGCLLRLPKQFDENQQSECRKLFELGLEKLIREQSYQGIVLASNWQDGHYYRIADMIKFLEPLGKQTVVVGQRIRFRERLPVILSSQITVASGALRAQAFVKPEERTINDTILERFSKDATVLDFYSLQCPDACTITDPDGALMYLDDSHLSVEGAREIGRRLKIVRPSLSE